MITSGYGKVVCSVNWDANGDFIPGITPDKIYDIIEIDRGQWDNIAFGYRILDDLGRKYFYYTGNFISLEEHRDKILEKILN